MSKIVIFVLAFLVASPVMAGPYLSANAGPSKGSVEAPSVPFTGPFTSGISSADKDGGSLSAGLGWREGKWLYAAHYVSLTPIKGSASSYGSTPGVSHVAGIGSKDTAEAITFTVGRAFRVHADTELQINVGAHLYESRREETGLYTQTDTATGAVISSETYSLTTKDSGVSYTYGAALRFVGDEGTGPYIAVQHYGEVDRTVTTIGIVIGL